jgi:hypothetical protein
MTGEQEVTREDEEGGTEEEGIEEEAEEVATLEYVINDLPLDLYIELMEGFHK